VSGNAVDPMLTSRISGCTGVQINGNNVQLVK